MRGAAIALAAVMAAVGAAGTAGAQAGGSPKARDFAAAAAQSDTFERMAATAALAQSTDPQVRAYATRMIADHDRTSASLTRATAVARIDPPPAIMNEGQSGMLGSLGALTGAPFDRAYWQQQALAHRSALVTERDYAEHGDNAPLRAAARAAVPVIEAHLAIAERMAGGSKP